MSQVHAHNVLNKLLEASTPYTLDSLHKAVLAEYGDEVRFHTCSQQDLTFDALMDFLLSKQKVVIDGEHVVANRDRMCNH